MFRLSVRSYHHSKHMSLKEVMSTEIKCHGFSEFHIQNQSSVVSPSQNNVNNNNNANTLSVSYCFKIYVKVSRVVSFLYVPRPNVDKQNFSLQ
jgi:hypothetical protein